MKRLFFECVYFFLGYLSLRITKTNVKVNLVGYLKTVGYEGKITTRLRDSGAINLEKRNKKFYGVAMAESIHYTKYIPSGSWMRTLAIYNPTVSAQFEVFLDILLLR